MAVLFLSLFRLFKMLSVDPTLSTVKVKSRDPRNSTNDQNSLPRADLVTSNPPPMPGRRLFASLDRGTQANAGRIPPLESLVRQLQH